MRLIAAFLTVVWLAGAVQPRVRAQDAPEGLIGNWRLASFVSFDERGGSRPSLYDSGRIMYDGSGQMAAQLMQSKADRKAAGSGYLGYYGAYTVDTSRRTVTHHVEGSSRPDFVGSDLVRHYELTPDGNQLKLSLKNGDRITATLTWERIRPEARGWRLEAGGWRLEARAVQIH